MNKIDIFRRTYKYDTLFIPDHIIGIDRLVFTIGYNNDNLDTIEAKKDGVVAIKKLLELDILYVYHWEKEHSIMKEKEISIEETIAYLDKIWFEGAKYPDLVGMITFETTKWYRNALKKLGMTNTTDWETFVEEKIGNLEQWIISNHPNPASLQKRSSIKKEDIDIFKIGYTYIDLFKPNNPKLLRDALIELDYDIYDIEYLMKDETKVKILNIIYEFIELKIFDIKWLKKHSFNNNKKLNSNATITYLDKIWKINKKGFFYKNPIKFIDSVMFSSSDWYNKKLAALGYNRTQDWETFVEEKIGNLEQWIEENRPKD